MQTVVRNDLNILAVCGSTLGHQKAIEVATSLETSFEVIPLKNIKELKG